MIRLFDSRALLVVLAACAVVCPSAQAAPPPAGGTAPPAGERPAPPPDRPWIARAREWTHECGQTQTPEVLVDNLLSAQPAHGKMELGSNVSWFTVAARTTGVARIPAGALTRCGTGVVDVVLRDDHNVRRYFVRYDPNPAVYNEYVRSRPPSTGDRGVFLLSLKLTSQQHCGGLATVVATYVNKTETARTVRVSRKVLDEQHEPLAGGSVTLAPGATGEAGLVDSRNRICRSYFPTQVVEADEVDLEGCRPGRPDSECTQVPHVRVRFLAPIRVTYRLEGMQEY